MQVIINGKSISVEQSMSLEKFLIQQSSYQTWCAVAVNGVFVPKSNYSDYYVKHGDQIEVLQAAQGG